MATSVKLCHIIENLITDINHVCVYLDDILVAGINKDHLQNLYGVLERLESARLTLKKSKCKFLVSSVEYLGHVIDTNSRYPSESKVRAIKEVPCPTSVTELRSSSDYSTFITSSYQILLVLALLNKLLLKAGVGLDHRKKPLIKQNHYFSHLLYRYIMMTRNP